MGLNMGVKHLYESMAINNRDYRREYTRLRDILRKRYATFKGSPYEKEMMARWSQYKKLRDVTSPKEFARILNTMYRDWKQGGNTLASYNAQRRKAIETLHARGLTQINESNLDSFNRFMAEARERWSELIPSSARVRIWQEWQESGAAEDDLWRRYNEWARRNLPADPYAELFDETKNL